MKERIYVDRLFSDYEDTPEISDFKEEIAGNLAERVRELISKGLDEGKAFDKAAAELGDITAIADEVGKKNRNDAIAQMYMRARAPITKRTAAGLTAATGLLLLAVLAALITVFSRADIAMADAETGGVRSYYISAVFLSAACGLYAYFGLTQETAAHYAMKKRRALAYGAVCMACFMGAGLAAVSFLFAGESLSDSVRIKAVFIIPAICFLTFLLMTETKRQKPWLKAMVERDIENSIKYHSNHINMVDPAKAARFGVASGGLWILAFAVFMTLHFAAGWHYAWLAFPFALAAQVFMVATIFEKK